MVVEPEVLLPKFDSSPVLKLAQLLLVSKSVQVWSPVKFEMGSTPPPPPVPELLPPLPLFEPPLPLLPPLLDWFALTPAHPSPATPHRRRIDNRLFEVRECIALLRRRGPRAWRDRPEPA